MHIFCLSNREKKPIYTAYLPEKAIFVVALVMMKIDNSIIFRNPTTSKENLLSTHLKLARIHGVQTGQHAGRDAVLQKVNDH